MTNPPRHDQPEPTRRRRGLLALAAQWRAKSPLVFWTALLGLLVGGYVLGVLPLGQQMAAWQERAAELGRNADDLRRLIAMERAALEQRNRESAGLRRKLARPADGDWTRAGQELEAAARRLAETAGLRVAASRALPPRPEHGLQKLPLEQSGTGEMNAFARFLALAAGADAPLTVDGFELKPEPGGGLAYSVAISRLYLP